MLAGEPVCRDDAEYSRSGQAQRGKDGRAIHQIVQEPFQPSGFGHDPIIKVVTESDQARGGRQPARP